MKSYLLASVLIGATVGILNACPAPSPTPGLQLQLDILGGTYNSTTESIDATSNSFTLYALLAPGQKTSVNDNYCLSMALVSISPTKGITDEGDYGYFTINGPTGTTRVVNVTEDMVKGTPPLEYDLTRDNNDLQTHDVFPTYFAQQGFNFDQNAKADFYNSQDNTGTGPTADPNGGMYYQAFQVDLSGLKDGYGIHFDLYSVNNVNEVATGSADVKWNAPFSHDAEGMKIPVKNTNIPEPGVLSMLGMGISLLFGAGFINRKRK